METLYRENVKIVSHYLYSMCKDEELTKDLTQETFLRAYESLERFDGSCKISTWLCQIAKHLLYQYWAKAGRQVHADSEELEQVPTTMAKDNTEHAAITRIELIDCLPIASLQGAVGQLHIDHPVAADMTHADHYSGGNHIKNV